MGMLVLRRKLHEKIVIGGRILITVVRIQGNSVKLGINAPGELPVHRWEVYNAIPRGEGDKPPPSPPPIGPSDDGTLPF